MTKYKSARHSTFNINFHIVFVTKYRKRILSDSIQISLKKFLVRKSHELNINIKAIESMSDHIHLFIQLSPSIILSNIVKILKGSVSRYLKCKYQQLSHIKALWSPSYFAESIGFISESTIIKYIQNQKTQKWKKKVSVLQ
jgi:putative transposase